MTPDFRDALLEPVVDLLGPHHRVYAPFVLTSVLLAAFAWHRSSRGTSLRRYLFPWRLFTHRSSRFDIVWLLIVRSVTQVLLAWPLRLSVLGAALVVCGNLREVLGGTPIDPPPSLEHRTTLFVAFSVCLFLADDLSRYLVHRLMHRVPALWELHKVHHSAEVLTPLTLYRVHPIESCLNHVRGGLSAGLVTGLFMWAFPGKLRVFEVLGVDALGFLWTAAGANLRHSHVWLRFPAFVERWIISPAQHQMHHARSLIASRSPPEPPRNYGSALAVWDRLFGTLRISTGDRAPRVGLLQHERNHESTTSSALFAPVVAAVRSLRGSRVQMRVARGREAAASPRAQMRTERGREAAASPRAQTQMRRERTFTPE